MKCLVCGKSYEAAECPRCRFPYIQVPANSPEDFLTTFQPTIHKYRLNFLKEVQLRIPIYRWKDQGGVVVEDRVDTVSLGTADVLKAQECWIDEKFARIPDEKEIPVTVRISANGDTWEKTVAVRNLHKPELQQLGATVDADFNLRLMLRNDTETPTASAPVPLFEL